MTKQDAIRILVADDHPIVREGLISLLDSQPDMTVVGEAGDGEEAIAQFQREKPDMALIDLRMPKVDGIQAIEAIRAESPSAHILVLTTFDADEDIYRGLRAGAQGYLLKNAPREELLATVRAAAAGQTVLPSNVAAKLTERLRSQELTTREMEVLRLIVLGRNNQEIAHTLYIAESTVKAHINSILNKLDVKDRTQAVVTALRRGIVRLE